ncbi:MAG TPA: hypothetical protein ENI07_25610 [Desulfobacterales bacterium]|nr:hypothetical protein [Desulfobacterales bacterium]
MNDPIAQYDHDEGTAVIGGFVYRGSGISALQGRYIFGDLSKTGANGRLFYLTNENRVVEFPLPGGTALNLWLFGFGQDASGEVYVLGNKTGVPFNETGIVFKIVS